jgi:hypothetical protein
MGKVQAPLIITPFDIKNEYIYIYLLKLKKIHILKFLKQFLEANPMSKCKNQSV